MYNFFSTIQITNDGYKGIVFNATNNDKVYETPVYENQQNAVNDVNKFISTNSATNTSQIKSNSKPNIVTTTIQLQPGSMPKRGGCCGQRS
jgi:bisphosphoglycerate-independent phosphoglycerate mutase (AlkP superfamily)